MGRGSMPGSTPLSDEELERLRAFFESIRNEEALTLEGLDGFFCALIAGPDLVMPSEYLPVVRGGELPDENAFASEEEANALLGLMMRHESPMNIERMLGLLWRAAPESVPDWLPMR